MVFLKDFVVYCFKKKKHTHGLLTMCDVLLAFFSTSCKCGGRGFLWSPVMSAVKQNTLLLEPLI